MVGSSSTRAVQAILILIVLTASLDFVASDLVEAAHAAESLGLKAADKLTGKVKSLGKFRQPVKGAKTASKIHKANHKLEKWLTPSSGVVGTVQVAAAGKGWLLPVRTADITDATAAVRIEGGGGCGWPPMPMPPTSISLFRAGDNLPLGGLTTARYSMCAGAATGTSAVLGLGRGGALASTFRTFSYQVLRSRDARGSLTGTRVWLGPAPGRTAPATTVPVIALRSSRYYVPVTGILIGGSQLLRVQPGIRQDATGGTYLTTTDPFTYLEGSLYMVFKDMLQRLYFPNVTPSATQQLCYSAVGHPLPPIAIIFNGERPMKVDWSNIWYRDGPNFCLAILPSPEPVSVLGAFLQSGRIMTISSQLGGGTTLTF